jgi:D-alanyl-lipoteichoic acid acyltransferase DltB (MBOAT superfamily)
MFFPQLVAGPIGRASHQLPQFLRERHITIDGLRDGMWLIFWGLFKKVCIADNLARFVDQNFARSAELNAPLAYLTVLAFAYQIYCDFSGYTDMARGLAKMMGFDILPNFRRPYAATDPQDFWRRWHISLSSWLRDYLYIPLGGSRGSTWFTYRNLLITMVLGGLWHGASWNFVWWGVYHGLLLVAFHAWTLWRKQHGGGFELPRPVATAVMFHVTLFGWLLFRCTRGVMVDGVWMDQSFPQIMEFLTSASRGFAWTADTTAIASALVLFVTPLLVLEWCLDPEPRQEDRGFFGRPGWAPVLAHAVIAFFIIRYGVASANAFIYFQF